MIPLAADVLIYLTTAGAALLTVGLLRYLLGRVLGVAGWLADLDVDDALFRVARAVGVAR